MPSPPLRRFLGKARDENLGAEGGAGALVPIPIYSSLTQQQVEHLLQISEEVLRPGSTQ
jgi:hypothetical protein